MLGSSARSAGSGYASEAISRPVVREQRLDGAVHVLGAHQRLVPLDVHVDVRRQRPGGFREPVGPARGLRGSHHGAPADRADRLRDPLVVRGDSHLVEAAGGARRFENVLNHRFSGEQGERLSRESDSAVARRDEPDDLHDVGMKSVSSDSFWVNRRIATAAPGAFLGRPFPAFLFLLSFLIVGVAAVGSILRMHAERELSRDRPGGVDLVLQGHPAARMGTFLRDARLPPRGAPRLGGRESLRRPPPRALHQRIRPGGTEQKPGRPPLPRTT